MKSNRYIVIALLLLASATGWAQHKNERYYVRKGNRVYSDSVYTQAEINYRKAIEQNPAFATAHYNLGDALLRQQKPKEAMQAFEEALKHETNKYRQAAIYHNMGVILQSQNKFAQAIDCYKDALRRTPDDDDTRYNLALCQHQLKNQPPEEQKQDQKDNKDGNNNNDKKEDQSKKQDKQQEKKDDKNKQEEQQQQQDKNNMSKQNAEQLLNAAMQEEKRTQEKMKQQAQPSRRRLEKQW